ncbi:MAG: beta-galactosidase, partial [Victivallaceae bacterium]|nr:beta-galactosidase [Victivallaceae bacterium]
MKRTRITTLFAAAVCVLPAIAALGDVQVDATVKKPNLLSKPASGTTAEVVSTCLSASPDKWDNVSLSFVTGKNGGEVTLRFRAKWSPRQKPQGVWFRRIMLNGVPLPPSLPHVKKTVSRYASSPENAEALLFTDYKDYAFHTFAAKPDTTYTVTAQFRDGGITIVPQDVRALDLTGAVNRTYADPDSGSGWTGQGPETDMAGFDFRQVSFGGMQFRLNDRVAVFSAREVPTDLKTLQAKGGNFPAKYLYLLHTAAWSRPGAVAGKITVTYSDNSTESFEVHCQKDVSDWATLSHLPNARPVYVRLESAGRGIVYLSRFELADKPVRFVQFTSPGEAAWILFGASLSSRKVSIAPEARTFQATAPEWKAPDFPSPVVEENSVLDLSPKGDVPPAGAFGRVVSVPGKGLRFEQKPEEPLRFQGMADTPIYIQMSAPVSDMHGKLRQLAQAASRQGYDLIRLWVDQHLMGKSIQKGIPDPARFDAYDFYMAELKKRGIYITIPIAFFRVGSVEYVLDSATGRITRDLNKLHAAAQARNTRKLLTLFGESSARKEWQDWAKTMLNHVNPYTKLAWKDDPMIAFVELYNEQELAIPHLFWGKNCDISPEAIDFIRGKFSTFLQNKYRTTDALNQAWDQKFHDFSEVRIPKFLGKDRTADDWEEFCFASLKENFQWGKNVLRKLGYKGIVAQYNFQVSMNLSRLARDHFDMVIRNTYYKHPSRSDAPGSRVGQESSVREGVPHFRAVAASRIAGLPLVVTEHNHCFWNRYQHENGLLFSSYAALQEWDGMCVHETPIGLEGKDLYLTSFRVVGSPVLRANEFLNSVLYKRGDVRPARTEILLDLGNFQAANANQSVNAEMSKLALIGKLGIASAHKPQNGPQVRVLPVATGSQVRAFAWHTEVADGRGVFSLPEALTKLRKSNLAIPPMKPGILTSDTGELTLDQNNRTFQ